MTIEQTVFQLLGPLCESRVYPDAAPEGATYPFATYQIIGGSAGWYLNNAMPDKKNARIQINVWSKQRLEANTLARRIERAFCESGLIAQPIGALTSIFDDESGQFGTRQDFGVWYSDAT